MKAIIEIIKSSILREILRLYPDEKNQVMPLFKRIMKTTFLKFYHCYATVRAENDKKNEKQWANLFAGAIMTGNSSYSFV